MPVLSPPRVLVLVLALLVFLVAAWDSGFHRRYIEPLLRFASRDQPIPAFFRNPRVGRVWSLLVVAILLVLWWFLGTPGAIPPRSR